MADRPFASLTHLARQSQPLFRYLSPEEYETLLNGADVTVKANDGRTWTARRTPNLALRLYMLAALHHGNPRAPRPSNDDALPAPLSGASPRRHPGPGGAPRRGRDTRGGKRPGDRVTAVQVALFRHQGKNEGA
jgi:hypothetical protein